MGGLAVPAGAQDPQILAPILRASLLRIMSISRQPTDTATGDLESATATPAGSV